MCWGCLDLVLSSLSTPLLSSILSSRLRVGCPLLYAPAEVGAGVCLPPLRHKELQGQPTTPCRPKLVPVSGSHPSCAWNGKASSPHALAVKEGRKGKTKQKTDLFHRIDILVSFLLGQRNVQNLRILPLSRSLRQLSLGRSTQLLEALS